MELSEGIKGIAAALAVIVLGIFIFMLVIRRHPPPEGLGFARLMEGLPLAGTIAERLLAEPPHSVFHKRTADRDLYLMVVEAGSSDTPDCVVGFADIGIPPATGDIAVLHSELKIPKILRRLQGGLFKWAEPADPAIDSFRPGPGWFWYAEDHGTVASTPMARVLARASRERGSRKLLGVASLGSCLVVWASLPHIDAVASGLEMLVREHPGVGEDDGRP